MKHKASIKHSISRDIAIRTRRTLGACAKHGSHDRGIAMLVVLVVVAMATVLGTAFLAAQSTTTGITRNLEDQAVARQIAESGLILIRNRIQNDETWRTGRTQGTWVSEQALGQGTFTVEIADDDGDPSNNDQDPFVLTVTGRYGNVTHVVRSRVVPYVSQGQTGLNVDYFHSSSALNRLNQVNWDATPNFSEVVTNVERVNSSSAAAYTGGPVNKWGARYSGSITLPSSGLWTFYTASDDGSNMSIDGNVVVNNDNNHSWKTKSGSKSLDAGEYAFETLFYENAGSHGVIAYWQGPGVSKEIIPASAFTRSGGDNITDNSSIPILVDGSIDMKKDSRIDSYDSAKGVYDSSNNKSDQAIIKTNGKDKGLLGFLGLLVVTMSDNATIEGNLYIDSLLGLLDVVTVQNAKIKGKVKKIKTSTTLPEVMIPSNAPSSEGEIDRERDAFMVSSNRHFSSVKLSGNVQATVQGDVTIWCDGHFEMKNNAKIIIATGSSLTLYLKDKLKLEDSATFNDASNQPGSLKIFIASKETIELKDNTSMSAIINAPLSELKLKDNAEFFGTYVGAKLKLDDRSQIHSDLRGTAMPEESETTYVFAWDEGF